MDKLISHTELLGKIAEIRLLRKGYYTNFFMDALRCEILIRQQILYIRYVNETLLIFQKESRFYHLFYCTTSMDVLQREIIYVIDEVSLPLVVDIVGQKENVSIQRDFFKSLGFEDYCSLNRMSRQVNGNNYFLPSSSVEYGSILDVKFVYSLLQDYFDPYSEQLPFTFDISAWAETKHMLLCKENDSIIGFVLFDIIGMTSYLRYWFVHPGHRDKKIGSTLLNRFFYESRATKRQLFWVIEDNENAIKRYRHYGFRSENMFDKVLIYRK